MIFQTPSLIIIMKKFLFITICMLFCVVAVASDRIHINVLNEITSQQAQQHPYPWTISTYKHTDYRGVTSVKYFVFADGIRHESRIILTRKKEHGCPWMAEINGRAYFVDFDGFGDYESLKTGDKGVLKYDDDRLYFYKE